MNLNIIELIDGYRFDSTVVSRGSFGHFDHNPGKPARWRARSDTAAQEMLIEQRHECAVINPFEMRIALAGLAVLLPASNRFKSLPGGFDQPPLGVGRKVDIGHNRTEVGPSTVAPGIREYNWLLNATTTSNN